MVDSGGLVGERKKEFMPIDVLEISKGLDTARHVLCSQIDRAM